MKTKTMDTFESLQKRKEIEKPLFSSLSGTVIKDIETAKATLRTMCDRKRYGGFLDKIRDKDANLISLKNMTPLEWRNVPLPVTDVIDKLVKHSVQASIITDSLKTYNDELVQIMQNFFSFFDANNAEMREQVHSKFLVLNLKAEGEITAARNSLTNYTEKCKQTTLDACTLQMKKDVDTLRAEMRAFVDDKYKVILRVMRAESDSKIPEAVKQQLQVPGLIGEG